MGCNVCGLELLVFLYQLYFYGFMSNFFLFLVGVDWNWRLPDVLCDLVKFIMKLLLLKLGLMCIFVVCWAEFLAVLQARSYEGIEGQNALS